MITFESVTKRYADGTVAADEVSFEVPEGELVVLVGPSGCGKTTALRMVNRMIEPTDGRITVNGEDAASVPAPRLRRDMGYVIQQVGLFPHLTIADNVATVPSLIGWDKDRTRERVEELIDTVGLSQEVANRYPRQLSGGQQQRVGVARALAADPPIMLMDEPFGAVDPIVRDLLQEEFLRLQRELKKTIIFVTHDIDEAMKMGDRVAIFNVGGILEQYSTPTDLLAEPANDFVVDFLGAERNLKRLALIPVSAVEHETGPLVSRNDSSDHAREAARESGTDWVIVTDAENQVEGWVFINELDGQQTVGGAEVQPFEAFVTEDESLRAALDVMVESPLNVAVRVDGDGRYEGVVTHNTLTGELK
ncbi:MAG: betaine/proline/choline family ABC transporter ATP-binding protein [Rubrobacter sp.]|nr:betaine/proline/choline family ABC transporter ATP-binding protein [Rubrobacter sp.]